jgi:hypothetical protein
LETENDCIECFYSRKCTLTQKLKVRWGKSCDNFIFIEMTDDVEE